MELKQIYKSFQYHTQLQWTGGRQGQLSCDGKPFFQVASPPEFKGPTGVWTPEDLFIASVDICTMTTFLAFAERKALPLVHYESAARGLLENVEGKYQFTLVTLSPRVTVASEEDIPKAEQILHDAHANCLIGNSIKTKVEVRPEFAVQKA
jgi:organic hydroperoxide reductase OsmC/OhrA